MKEFFEEHIEEQKRLKKGDPKGDKKGRSFKNKPFIPADEIPDSGSIDIEEKVDKKLLKKNIVETPEEEVEEYNEGTNYEEETPEDIGVIVKGDTAHAGPEFKKLESQKGINLIKEEKLDRKSISVTRDILPRLKEFIDRKYMKFMSEKVGKGKENLKTLKKQESKIQKNTRGKIREALHNPESWDDSNKRMDPMDVLSDDDLISGE